MLLVFTGTFTFTLTIFVGGGFWGLGNGSLVDRRLDNGRLHNGMLENKREVIEHFETR